MLTDAPVLAFVATSDLDRAHAFYGDVLGLRRVETTPFASVYDGNGTTLRVTRVERVAAAPYTVLGWAVADVDGAIAALASRGVVFEQFAGVEQEDTGVWTAPDGTRIAWFRDPDGNTLSVAQFPMP
jgi:catechol 2,3-dioxygenase-like lactoylglutathione lyase family enzyme